MKLGRIEIRIRYTGTSTFLQHKSNKRDSYGAMVYCLDLLWQLVKWTTLPLTPTYTRVVA